MRRVWVLAAVCACVVAWEPETDAAQEFAVPPPPLSEDYYPCSQCHADLSTDPTPRHLTDEHTDIVFDHAEQFRWCLDCHDARDRDKLHLQSGERLDFGESYRLCGQCHGDKYRDWRAGIHGKRTGRWDGEKQYLLCAHCHDPHSPRYVLRADPAWTGTSDRQPEPPPQVPGSQTLPARREGQGAGGH